MVSKKAAAKEGGSVNGICYERFSGGVTLLPLRLRRNERGVLLARVFSTCCVRLLRSVAWLLAC